MTEDIIDGDVAEVLLEGACVCEWTDTTEELSGRDAADVSAAGGVPDVGIDTDIAKVEEAGMLVCDVARATVELLTAIEMLVAAHDQRCE